MDLKIKKEYLHSKIEVLLGWHLCISTFGAGAYTFTFYRPSKSTATPIFVHGFKNADEKTYIFHVEIMQPGFTVKQVV